MRCTHCGASLDHEPERCTKRPLGPRMKRLIAHFMSVDAIPPGGSLDPFGAGLAFLLDRERMAASARNAFHDAVSSVVAVRTVRDFASLGLPDDAEETIAGELIRRIEERVTQQRQELAR